MTDTASVLASCTGIGSVVAPAGYGKTHLIASALAQAQSRQLVLTHTYAGVSVLRRRLRERGVPARNAQVDTIASWCLRICLAYGGAANWTSAKPADGEWEDLYAACAALLHQPFIERILKASYGGIYVDEYQDCSRAQHEVVLMLAKSLPCRVLGDPLRRSSTSTATRSPGTRLLRRECRSWPASLSRTDGSMPAPLPWESGSEGHA